MLPRESLPYGADSKTRCHVQPPGTGVVYAQRETEPTAQVSLLLLHASMERQAVVTGPGAGCQSVLSSTAQTPVNTDPHRSNAGASSKVPGGGKSVLTRKQQREQVDCQKHQGCKYRESVKLSSELTEPS